MDKYQERYIAHQAKKKDQLMYSIGEAVDKPTNLIDLLKYRRSQRVYNTESIEVELPQILEAACYAPNSCNRHGIELKVITERTDKNLLSGILVGGVGWCYRAQAIVLFMANPEAYKSPNEKDFMHYCDVGFTAMNMWLAAEALDVGAAYINPNIMPENKAIFQERFGNGIFCGALTLGKYDTKATKPEFPQLNEILCT